MSITERGEHGMSRGLRTLAAIRFLPIMRQRFAVSGGPLLAGLAAHFPDNPFDVPASTGGFELMGLTRARVPFKAARFRARKLACAAPRRFAVSAFERAASSRGPKCPIEAAQGAWLQNKTKGISHQS